jgi:hypothetical protein
MDSMGEEKIAYEDATCIERKLLLLTVQLTVQSPEILKLGEAMLVELFKRTFSLLIPTALIFFALQYYETGKVTVAEIAVYLIAFVFVGTAFEALNVLWRRRFGTGKGSTMAKAGLWLAAAVCLYLFFRHMDRG